MKSPESNPHEAAPSGNEDTARVSITAYLGSMPDYGADVKGVKLAGVTDGSPAEKSGLKRGDVVIAFGGKPIATIYDYTQALARDQAGRRRRHQGPARRQGRHPQGHPRLPAAGELIGPRLAYRPLVPSPLAGEG